MPLPKRSTTRKKFDVGWITTDSGYQKTNSPQIILHSLERLKADRRFINLAKKNYSSGNTVLVNFSTKYLELDRPLDWPPQLAGPLFIQFLDSNKILNHYKTKVIKVTDTSIFTEFPFELYQLQRRQFYRVSVPGVNSVSFDFKGNKRSGLIAQDLSIRGILLCKKSPQIFTIGDEIKNLSLEIFPANQSVQSSTAHTLHAQQGEVVRLDRNPDRNRHVAGLKLFPDRAEEKMLQRYIHQRELSDLRKQ